MPYDYAWEKFYIAMRSLAGEGPLRTRLMTAILSFHTLHMAKDGPQVPPEIQNKFDEFWEKLNVGDPVDDEGIWRASINEMTDQQVRESVNAIVDMYDAVARHQEPWPD